LWDRRAALGTTLKVRLGPFAFAGKNIVMVDDDIILELWRRFLKDPRTSNAEIQKLSLLAKLHYEDFRLQLIAWSLKNEP
jgi:hypothetical protein